MHSLLRLRNLSDKRPEMFELAYEPTSLRPSLLHEVQALVFQCVHLMAQSWLRAVTPSMAAVWNRCGCVLITQRSPNRHQTALQTQKLENINNQTISSDLSTLRPLWKSFTVYITEFKAFIITEHTEKSTKLNQFQLSFLMMYIVLIIKLHYLYLYHTFATQV